MNTFSAVICRRSSFFEIFAPIGPLAGRPVSCKPSSLTLFDGHTDLDLDDNCYLHTAITAMDGWRLAFMGRRLMLGDS